MGWFFKRTGLIDERYIHMSDEELHIGALEHDPFYCCDDPIRAILDQMVDIDASRAVRGYDSPARSNVTSMVSPKHAANSTATQ